MIYIYKIYFALLQPIASKEAVFLTKHRKSNHVELGMSKKWHSSCIDIKGVLQVECYHCSN